MVRIILIVSSCVFICAVLAHAQSRQQYTVYLKNGRAVRGELVELSPNKYITLRKEDGKIQKFKYKDVRRFVGDTESESVKEVSQEDLQPVMTSAPEPSGDMQGHGLHDAAASERVQAGDTGRIGMADGAIRFRLSVSMGFARALGDFAQASGAGSGSATWALPTYTCGIWVTTGSLLFNAAARFASFDDWHRLPGAIMDDNGTPQWNIFSLAPGAGYRHRLSGSFSLYGMFNLGVVYAYHSSNVYTSMGRHFKLSYSSSGGLIYQLSTGVWIEGPGVYCVSLGILGGSSDVKTELISSDIPSVTSTVRHSVSQIELTVTAGF